MKVVAAVPAAKSPGYVIVTLACGHKEYHREPFTAAQWPCNACVTGRTAPGPAIPGDTAVEQPE